VRFAKHVFRHCHSKKLFAERNQFIGAGEVLFDTRSDLTLSTLPRITRAHAGLGELRPPPTNPLKVSKQRQRRRAARRLPAVRAVRREHLLSRGA
jgi:hypothetical protein